MKRVIAIIFAVALLCSSALCAFAAEGNVSYSGDAGEFIFTPGSERSVTDLFVNFKGVMPGDVISQEITVENKASNKVKVKIYMRSLGAHDDSIDFLSKLGLTVAKAEENEMAYMFDATADKTAQLTEWVCLGTLYSGGKVNLDVNLHMPTDVGNEYSEKIGYLDWEFMVEEYPIEPTDPQPPKTGDTSNILPWIITLVSSAAVLFILILLRRKRDNSEETNPAR